jgi:hypothetical protein
MPFPRIKATLTSPAAIPIRDDDDMIRKSLACLHGFYPSELIFPLRHIIGDSLKKVKRTQREKVEMSNSIKSLVKALGEQAGLDEVLRNNKIWFAGEPEERKWAALKK